MNHIQIQKEIRFFFTWKVLIKKKVNRILKFEKTVRNIIASSTVFELNG